ncbi:MAG: hypothetical protein AAF333_15150 [Planctomycetota bacterium]
MRHLPLQPLAYNAPAKPNHWHPDGWCFRGVATTLALAVSGLFAVLLLAEGGLLFMIAAGLAWSIFLMGIWNCSEPQWKYARLDWCFWTMTVGCVVMAAGLFLGNLFPAHQTPLLLGALGVADVAMGWVFTRYAPTVGVSRPKALGLWAGCMNGLFVLLVVAWPIAILAAFVACVPLLAITLGQAVELKTKATP